LAVQLEVQSVIARPQNVIDFRLARRPFTRDRDRISAVATYPWREHRHYPLYVDSFCATCRLLHSRHDMFFNYKCIVEDAFYTRIIATTTSQYGYR
jgi:hypothetical protein